MTKIDGGRRQAPPVTPERLERAALRYLERFSASVASLRRVLMARVRRSEREHGTDGAHGAAAVDALIARYLVSGLLNDTVYAEAKASSLRRRGASARAIREHLAMRGVDKDTTAAALHRADDDRGAGEEEVGEGADNGDLAAARAYAKRRRLGPFRHPDARAANRARDLAALGRAGFDYETARRVVDDACEDEA